MDHKASNVISIMKKRPLLGRSNPKELVVLSRKKGRKELGLSLEIPFSGADIWHFYELCWLGAKGKPMLATGHFSVPASSAAIVESKSVKSYLTSFNESQFDCIERVEKTLQRDLSQYVGEQVYVALSPVGSVNGNSEVFDIMLGKCLDEQDVDVNSYTIDPNLLLLDNTLTNESLYSHLLQTNCFITNEPVWGSLQVKYSGRKINHEGLLRYLLSYRGCQVIHEQCVERIYTDIMNRCMPKQLTVYACFARRGGISISPFRSNFESKIAVLRSVRS